MNTTISDFNLKGVRLSQTTISSYFKSLSGRCPSPCCEPTKIKRKPRRERKRIQAVAGVQTSNFGIKPEVGMAVVSRPQKRKLFVQIFSEDEDDDVTTAITNPGTTISSDKTISSPMKKPTTTILVNKPKVKDYTPEKLQEIHWKPMPVIPFLKDAARDNSLVFGTPQMSSTQLGTPLLDDSSNKTSSDTPERVPSRHSVSTVFCCASTSSASTPASGKSGYDFSKSVVSRRTYLESSSDSDESAPIIKAPPKRPRGRPKKIQNQDVEAIGDPKITSNGAVNSQTVSKIKLSKNSVTTSERRINSLYHIVSPSSVAKPFKRPAGRPRKETEESVAKNETKKPNYYNLTIFQNHWEKLQIKKHLKGVLAKNDREMLEVFFKMKKDHQYTCIKLFGWKCIWYNVFRYTEKIRLKLTDKEVMEMYDILKRNRFVDTDYMSESAFMLLNVLETKDVKDIYKKLKISGPAPTKKEDYIAKLLNTCNTQSTLTYPKTMEQILKDRVHEKLGFCIKLSTALQDALFKLHLVNTFANPNFVTPDAYFNSVGFLNLVFPAYQVDDTLVFYTEEEFSRYANAVMCCNELEKVIENKKTESAIVICKDVFSTLQELVQQGRKEGSRLPYLQHLTAISKYIRCLSIGCKYLLTTQHLYVKNWLEYLLSLPYLPHKHGDWYVQLAHIQTTYLKEYELAAKTVINALENDRDKLTEVQLHDLAKRGRILNKKTFKVAQLFHDQIAALSPARCDRLWPSITIDRRAMNNEGMSGGKARYVQVDASGARTYLSVEQAAIQHYLGNGYSNAEHYEGSAVCALFCLLFWDVIYDTYVPGAFVSEAQTFPLDMYTAFYANRETVIKKRLQEIGADWSMEKLGTVLTDNWNAHSHEESLCKIDKVFESPDQLEGIVKCIGRQVLSRIFERLVINFREHRSGFPDLLIWDVATEKSKFVEVKGERDTLSIKQKLWLNYLSDVGADIELCHVHSIGFKNKAQPKKQKSATSAT